MQALDPRSFQAVEDLGCIIGSHMLVHLLTGGGDERPFGAESHAANAFGLAVVTPAPFGDFFVEGVFDRLALAGEASRRDADIHPMSDSSLRLPFGFGDLFQFFRRHGESIWTGAPAWIAGSLYRQLPGRKPRPEPARRSPGSGQ